MEPNQQLLNLARLITIMRMRQQGIQPGTAMMPNRIERQQMSPQNISPLYWHMIQNYLNNPTRGLDFLTGKNE